MTTIAAYSAKLMLREGMSMSVYSPSDAITSPKRSSAGLCIMNTKIEKRMRKQLEISSTSVKVLFEGSRWCHMEMNTTKGMRNKNSKMEYLKDTYSG